VVRLLITKNGVCFTWNVVLDLVNSRPGFRFPRIGEDSRVDDAALRQCNGTDKKICFAVTAPNFDHSDVLTAASPSDVISDGEMSLPLMCGIRARRSSPIQHRAE
jgi:hypothetical protein